MRCAARFFACARPTELALGLLSFTSTSVQAGDELRTPWREQRSRALNWKACERWNVLRERRWRHDMPRYDRSRKHGAKRFYRRWMREVMSNIRSMGHVTVRPLVCFPTGVRRVKQTLLSDHHRDGPSPAARTRTNATGWDLPSGQLLASHHCSCRSHAMRHRLCGGASTYESDCGER
jgi:hypothetical protein